MSHLIRIIADEDACTFDIELVLAAVGRDFPIKHQDWHVTNYYIMHQQARWEQALGVQQTLRVHADFEGAIGM